MGNSRSTKFEFGLVSSNGNGLEKKELILIDELLTSGSSRYWFLEEYSPGAQPSFDKKYVRDWKSWFSGIFGKWSCWGRRIDEEVVKGIQREIC